MFLARLFLFLLLGGARVDKDFLWEFIQARLAWGLENCPHVTEMRWCREEECEFLSKGPYVAYTFGDGRIIFTQERHWYSDALQSTVSHEMGHSLGVQHGTYGVMNDKWDWPVMLFPTDQEKNSVKAEYKCQK